MPIIVVGCPKIRMDKRSPKGWAGEWRKHWLSGHAPCRLSIGAPFREGIASKVVNSSSEGEMGNPNSVPISKRRCPKDRR
jgi:hypothetical protein